MELPCPFEVLGLSPETDASAQLVVSAWRHRSLDCHPDKRPGDPTAKAKFEALTDAKDALLDPKRKGAAVAAAARRHRYREQQQRSGARAARAATQGVRRASGGNTATAARNSAGTAGSAPPAPPADPWKAEEVAAKAAVARAAASTAAKRRATEVFYRHLARRHWLAANPVSSPAPEEAIRLPGLRPTRKRMRVVPPTMSRPSQEVPASSLQARRIANNDDSALAHTKASLADAAVCARDVANQASSPARARPPEPGPPMCAPLRLPTAVSTRVLAAETGAPRQDARELARIVHALRRAGGEAAITKLSKRPRKLQRLLSRYPRLFDVFLPGRIMISNGQPMCIHVRLRAEALTLTAPASASGGMPSETMANNNESNIIDLDCSSDEAVETISPFPILVNSPRRGPLRRLGRATQVRHRVRTWRKPACCTVTPRGTDVLTRLRLVPSVSVVVPDSDDDALLLDDEESAVQDEEQGVELGRMLGDAFASCRGAWRYDVLLPGSEDPRTMRRCAFLLPAGQLGALRHEHREVLFVFNYATKVLYEYIPSEGRCTTVWSPTDPRKYAAIWTVLPLPPEPPIMQPMPVLKPQAATLAEVPLTRSHANSEERAPGEAYVAREAMTESQAMRCYTNEEGDPAGNDNAPQRELALTAHIDFLIRLAAESAGVQLAAVEDDLPTSMCP